MLSETRVSSRRSSHSLLESDRGDSSVSQIHRVDKYAVARILRGLYSYPFICIHIRVRIFERERTKRRKREREVLDEALTLSFYRALVKIAFWDDVSVRDIARVRAIFSRTLEEKGRQLYEFYIRVFRINLF